jgi:hypothetical protein
MNMESTKPAQTGETFEADAPPTIHELVSCWYWGEPSEDVAGLLTLCNIVAPDPVAQWLYVFGEAGDLRRGNGLDTLESWCWGMAAEAACTAARYRPERMANYRRRWARQAGQDGAALAMWGRGIRDDLPGVQKRAERYGCRPADYLQVRSYVEVEADRLIRGFRTDMDQALRGAFDSSFRARYYASTGRDIPAYA